MYFLREYKDQVKESIRALDQRYYNTQERIEELKNIVLVELNYFRKIIPPEKLHNDMLKSSQEVERLKSDIEYLKKVVVSIHKVCENFKERLDDLDTEVKNEKLKGAS